MKWLRRIRFYLTYLLLVTLISCLVVFYLYRGTPSWYRPPPTDQQQIDDTANSANQKLQDLNTWAANVRAQQLRKSNGNSSSDGDSISSKTITLSDDEVNALFETWKSPDESVAEGGNADGGGANQQLARSFTDGRVFFTRDGIILAGQSPALGAIVSGQFAASIDDQAKLRLSIVALRIGRLPIPQSTAASYLQQLQILIQDRLADQLPYVNIDRNMNPNSYAVTASWTKLLLSALSARPTDSYLIIPPDPAHSNLGLPIRLTALELDDGQITLTLEPITTDDRQSLLEGLQQAGAGSR
jgi:hypothetical protein